LLVYGLKYWFIKNYGIMTYSLHYSSFSKCFTAYLVEFKVEAAQILKYL